MSLHATIYHNPACGTSRNTLALLRHLGIETVIIEYLITPPDRETLTGLITAAGLTVRQAVREQGTPFAKLGLDRPDVDDEQLLDAMQLHPILINRPFVVTGKGTRLCRPSELVLEITPPLTTPFIKEDGQEIQPG